MDVREQMRRFMEPRSIALIGVPSKVGKGALNILENLLQLGFKGEIYPVNPRIRELLGHQVFPDVRAIPKEIDLAVIMNREFQSAVHCNAILYFLFI